MSYNESMKTNGAETKPSLLSAILAQLSDHFDLATLELRYEVGIAGRRLLVFGIALILGLTAFALLQISLVFALMKIGLSISLACLILAVVYAGVAVVLGVMFGRRSPKSGAPFAATQREVKESLRWIQKLFS